MILQLSFLDFRITYRVFKNHAFEIEKHKLQDLKHNYQDFETSIPWFTMDPCCFNPMIPRPQNQPPCFCVLVHFNIRVASDSYFYLLECFYNCSMRDYFVFQVFSGGWGAGKGVLTYRYEACPPWQTTSPKVAFNNPKLSEIRKWFTNIRNAAGREKMRPSTNSLDVNQPTLIQSVPTKHK